MQRLHEDDPSGNLLGSGGWRSLVLPSIATTDEDFELFNGRVHHRQAGEPLDPLRDPFRFSTRCAAIWGSGAFEAQYQQTPIRQPATWSRRIG
jgi:hypothetical protein